MSLRPNAKIAKKCFKAKNYTTVILVLIILFVSDANKTTERCTYLVIRLFVKTLEAT